MRPQDWPERLDTYLTAARAKPFAWGRHDCVLFVCGWHAIATAADVYAPFRGAYDSEASARDVMAEHGVADYLSAGTFLFGEPCLLARIGRGDIVLAEGALGISTGTHGMFLTPATGLVPLRRARFVCGWSI